MFRPQPGSIPNDRLFPYQSLFRSWQIESVADGYHFSRADRGVTDHYVVDLPFLASAEARKLHGLAAEEAASYAKPSRLVTVKQAAAREDEDGEGQPPQQSAGSTIRLRSEEHTSELQSLMRI